jgi:hypothetical protein
MGLWVSKILMKHVVPAVDAALDYGKEKAIKAADLLWQSRKGQIAKQGAKVVGKSAVTYAASCFPGPAIAVGLAAQTGQLIYERNRPGKGYEEGHELVLAKVKGVATFSVSAIVLLHLASLGYFDPTSLEISSLNYLVTIVGGITGTWVTSLVLNGNQESKTVIDGPFSRIARGKFANVATQAALDQIPVVWPLNQALSLVLPPVAGMGAHYAFPLIQAENRFPQYAPYDPNLLLKILTNTLYGSTENLAETVIGNKVPMPELNRLMKGLLAKGVSQNVAINFIVRAFNRYSTLSKKPDTPSPIAASVAAKMVKALQKKEIELFGFAISDPDKQTETLKGQIQGFLTYALNQTENLFNESPALTEEEVSHFYINLSRIVWSLYPSIVTQKCEQLTAFAIPLFLQSGSGVFEVIFGQVEIDDDIYFDAREEFDDDEVSNENPLDPSRLVKSAIETVMGGSRELATKASTKLPAIPWIKGLAEKVVEQGIDKDLFVNALVRSVNAYTQNVYQNKEIKGVIDNFMQNKMTEKELFDCIDHVMGNKFSVAFVNLLSKQTKEGVAKIVIQLEPLQLGVDLKKVEILLEAHLRGFLMSAFALSKRANFKPAPLTNAEIENFYTALTILAFMPYKNDPLLDALQTSVATALPHVVEKRENALPGRPEPTKPLLRNYFKSFVGYVVTRTVSAYQYLKNLFY